MSKIKAYNIPQRVYGCFFPIADGYRLRREAKVLPMAHSACPVCTVALTPSLPLSLSLAVLQLHWPLCLSLTSLGSRPLRPLHSFPLPGIPPLGVFWLLPHCLQVFTQMSSSQWELFAVATSSIFLPCPVPWSIFIYTTTHFTFTLYCYFPPSNVSLQG